MRRLTLLFALLLVLSCTDKTNKIATKTPLSLSASTIEAAIRQLEEVDWATASAKKDEAWFNLHLADELILTTGRTGEVTNKQQVIAEIMDTAYGSGSSDKIEELKIIPFTNAGIATFKILSIGKDKKGNYFRVARYTELWIYRAERWQLLSSHSSLLPEKG